MPERREPPDPQGEQTARLTPRPDAPRPTGPSRPDSVWAPPGQNDTRGQPPGDDTREQPTPGHRDAREPLPPGETGEDAWPDAGREAPTQPVQGWGGQSAAVWNGPPAWEEQAQGAPPAWGQQPSEWGQPPAGWGPPPSGGRSRRVPVAAVVAAALLVLVAIGAVVVVRGVQAVRTVASSATTAPAPFAPGTGNGGAGNGGGGTPGGSGGAPGGGGSSPSGGSVRLPDQVDGLDRLELNEPGFLDGQQDMLDMVTRTGAIDGWGVGAYGRDASEPAFVLLVVKAKEAGAAGMLGGAMTDSIRNSLGGDLSEPTRFTRDGVRYECSKGKVGNLCSFQDGALIGIGFGRGGGLERLSRLTADARRGVRS
jgi:hypothetical protein